MGGRRARGVENIDDSGRRGVEDVDGTAGVDDADGAAGIRDVGRGLDQHEKSKCASRISRCRKGAGWKTSMVSRVPMTLMLLLESRMSGECTEVAEALCGGGCHGERSRFLWR